MKIFTGSIDHRKRMSDFLLILPRRWSSLKLLHQSTAAAYRYDCLRSGALLIFYENTLPTRPCGDVQSLINYMDLNEMTATTISAEVLKMVKGSVDFRYFILSNPDRKQINVYTTLFNILPIYYYSSKDVIIVSSKAALIARSLPNFPSLNKKFVLEQMVFNYPFQNATIYQNIHTVPANCYLEIKSTKGLGIVKHTSIEDYFGCSFVPWKESLGTMSDLFLERTKDYFPEEQFYISFTSGLDGRALVASAHNSGKNFKTFAFGATDNEDITIPTRNSRELGLDFNPVYLDDRYAKNHFVSDGTELLNLTDGGSSFLHVHYLYSARYLSQYTNYIINGMFGSELFRALHIRGQITSQALVDFFYYKNENEWIRRLKESLVLNYVRTGNFKEELDDLIDDLLSYRKQYGSLLNTNQFFYKFIFEEALRKTFGYFIISQLPYVKIRAPFLDLVFIKNLLRTGLAGVNNEFLTHNPLKRFKGQLLYAKIIEKSYRPLYHQITGKGYRVKDLISSYGKMHVALGYCHKRLIKTFTRENFDNLGIISGVRSNTPFFRAIVINQDLYKADAIRTLFNNTNWISDIYLRDVLIQLLSTNYYLGTIFN